MNEPNFKLVTVTADATATSGQTICAGTNAAVQSSWTTITFGTTSPSISLAAGTYLIFAQITVSASDVVSDGAFRIYDSTGAAAVGTAAGFTLSAADESSHTQTVTLTARVTLASTSTVVLQSGNKTAGSATIISTDTHIGYVKLA